MGYSIQFYSFPQGQVAKVRRGEGLEDLRRRLDTHGSAIFQLKSAQGTAKGVLDALDRLLDTSLCNLLGAVIGDLDGRKTDPRAGRLNADDLSDAVDAFEHLAEAIELDPDEEDDEDIEQEELFHLRNRLEGTAEAIDMGLDEFEVFVDELLETFKAAVNEERELIALVSSD